MDFEYLERNRAYVAMMEEAIERLKDEGRILSVQSLYAFVGEEVAISKAKVSEFLHERGDAPQGDDFWDLRGIIFDWATRHGVYGEAAHKMAMYLSRITEEVRWSFDVYVLYELHQLKEQLKKLQPPDQPKEPEAWTDEPDDRDY